MAKVVSISSAKKPADKVTPYKSGHLHCLACKYSWEHSIATAKDDVSAFDCVQCGLEKAVWAGLYVPPDGKYTLRCEGCDGENFKIVYPNSALCIFCGTYSKIS